MAAFFRRIFSRSTFQNGRIWQKFQNPASRPSRIQALVLGGAACCSSYIIFKRYYGHLSDWLMPFSLPNVQAKDEGVAGKESPSNYREMRFRQFASVEYDNNLYMTPQDFLESVTEATPRARIGRSRLSSSDVEHMLKNTPTLHRGSDKLFRKLHDRGIISYTEYLFLLCVLTMSCQTGPTKFTGKSTNEPHSGFLIAFNMFDTDGNQIVDKREFLVLESFFILPPKERKFVPRDPQKVQKLLDLEKVFSSGPKEAEEAGPNNSASAPGKSTGSQALRRRARDLNTEIPDTTLLVHFFGRNGKNVLKYKDFHRFMENLQSEVIELEFLEFSKGLNTISEVEFARILLRYTNLDRGDVEDCLNRVRERMPNEKGITFTEFKKFCQFLNNLDDFAIAMKMYTFAQQPVSQEEFQRAVMVCTGFTLSSHIVSTVFNIFDTDGDGHLSHKEFISIMKDRLHRGARSHLMHSQNTWEAFKTCVKNEMRTF
ncbi:calcium uptake protein 3, mitochondrial [Aplysia californica]|uniref:Calcium uptake protein 3, mitochondrial n=1 Tax=Aplysia californica TaxID=6500 RepID=A0ABM1W0V3_APLCA|nr:calcium uptake protein 3, mitochondrial [Aplysia californica]